MSKPNDYDTYIIPPNFIEGGTFFGGLLKLRNTAEALFIVLALVLLRWLKTSGAKIYAHL